MADISALDPNQWELYKELRLLGLKESPLAFGKSYEEEVDMTDSEWIERLERVQQGKSWLLFAFDGEKAVGMVGAYRDKLQKFNHTVHVNSVYVHPDYRGQGLGKLLMAALLERIESKAGIEKVKLMVTATQEAAIMMYSAFGFRNVGVQQKEMCYAGEYYDEVIMEKIL